MVDEKEKRFSIRPILTYDREDRERAATTGVGYSVTPNISIIDVSANKSEKLCLGSLKSDPNMGG